MRAEIKGFGNEHYQELFALDEEGLIKGLVSQALFQPKLMTRATITAKGRRFLREGRDFITVKLHEDTLEALRGMLLSALTQTTAPESQKGALRKAIESAPGTAIAEAVKMTMAAGFQRAPELLNQLQIFLSQHLGP